MQKIGKAFKNPNPNILDTLDSEKSTSATPRHLNLPKYYIKLPQKPGRSSNSVWQT